MENVQTLLCEMQGQTHQAAASLETIQVLKSLQTIQVLKCIICKYNWIPDFTIIMLVHKITWILQIGRGLLANQNADSEYNV